MIKFTQAVALWHNWLLKKLPWTKYFVVMEEFVWYIDFEKKWWKIVVEKWTVTDMWSIPQFLQFFISRDKFISFILHDTLMCSKKYTRKQSDRILISAMNVEWASTLEKVIVYIWVRIGALFGIWKCKDDD